MAIQIAGNQIKNNAVQASQIADSTIGSSKLNLSDNFVFAGQLRANVPSNAADVATKGYIDGIVGSGVFWKEPAAAASTANVNLSNPGTSSFDGQSVSSGARILIRAQSSSAENGVYIFNGNASAMTRATDADSASEINGMAIFCTDGNTFSDQAFVQTSTVSSLGSDAVTYVRFSGLGQVTAGDGLAQSGDTLSVNVDDSGIEINSDALRLKDAGVTNDKLAGSISADKLAGNIGDGKLSTITSSGKVSGSAVQLNGSGGLSNSSGLKISDLGVSAAMLAGSIPDSKLNQITTGDKVAGSAVQLKSGGGLEDSSGLAVETNGIETAMIGANQVTAAKINFEPTRQTLSTNGNDTAFQLSDSVPSNFDDVFVFRNGLFVDRVASNPSGTDEFTSVVNSGTCTVTFGSAPASTDKVVVKYFALKS